MRITELHETYLPVPGACLLYTWSGPDPALQQRQILLDLAMYFSPKILIIRRVKPVDSELCRVERTIVSRARVFGSNGNSVERSLRDMDARRRYVPHKNSTLDDIE